VSETVRLVTVFALCAACLVQAAKLNSGSQTEAVFVVKDPTANNFTSHSINKCLQETLMLQKQPSPAGKSAEERHL